MERYEKYKPTDLEWIGKIPEHWEVKKIKHRCYVKGRVGWNGLKSSEFLTDGYSYLITGTDFKKDVIDWKNCYHIDEERYIEDPFIQLKNEDLLITKDGTIGKLAVVTNLEKPACLNSGIFVVRSLNPDLTTRFLFWVLKSKSFTEFNDLTAYGSTIQHLYQNVFVEFAFAFPLIHEQYSIATYLDRKTAEIDKIIANKQKLIAIYEEEKQAIINQAVTRGVNPNVRLKPSGVEWLGDIPKHWEVKRLKHLADLKSGEGITSENIKEIGEYPVYGGNGLRGYFDSFTHEGSFVLIGRQGALCGNVNYGSGRFWASEHAVVCTLKDDYNTRWFGELLRTMNLNQYSVAAAQPGLSVENLKVLQIPVPPVSEQQFIVSHIEKESIQLDTIIEKCKKQIKLLKEYRTTLISEVVTGKVKVI